MYDRYDCRIFCFVGYSNFAFTFLAELLSEQYPCSVSQKLYTFLLLDLFRLRLVDLIPFFLGRFRISFRWHEETRES